MKELIYNDIAKQIAKIVEERLLPTNLSDDEIKTVSQEDLKLIIKLMASFKSSYSNDFDKH